jgi:hypothetical protein
VEDQPAAEAALALSEEERRQLTSDFERELEQGQALRLAALEQRTNVAHARAREVRDLERKAEIAVLRKEVQDRFFREHHYELVHDKAGNEQWLSPAEVEWYRKHPRKRRKRGNYEVVTGPKSWLLGMYILVGFFAIAAGFLLAR